ncbi:NAD(P)H-binding protein [Kineosporia mesophila]|uniref:NAD(P)H-binding protein n=1 Tax=Kineosporia mesophila TaxID=566012 RepID=A0ABP6ZC15_9ACTN|nr:SDR family oxidoreductase [Kineosporia mesophila]
MKIVVIGGSGLIGAQVVPILSGQGHDVVAASPSTGVNTLTGEGLVLEGADVVVDVSNSPSFADDDVMSFFTTSTGVLLEAGKAAGVRHHVVLSIVGTDRIPDSGYMRAKVAQEKLVRDSGVGYSIVRATQFFEFATGIAGMSRDATGVVRLPSVFIQPIAASEVARIVAGTALDAPVNGHIDIAGPRRYRLDEFIRLAVPEAQVVTDEAATYSGARLQPTSLVPVGEVTRLSEVGPSWEMSAR